jgi:threonine dehydrogenase-like Zn-dependent dehydrogenase
MGRAAVFPGPGKPFELREYPVPEPDEQDLVVKVSRTNICGSDIHMWRGEAGVQDFGFNYDMILGHEMVGTVVSRGKKRRTDSVGRGLKEGDRVVFTYYISCNKCRACHRGDQHMCVQAMTTPIRPCMGPPHFVGGFADYYYVSGQQSIFKVPDTVSDSAVAGANCALSQVLHGISLAGVNTGDAVVVQGAGGLGLYACAVARSMGAQLVIAVDSVPERLEMAQKFGADHVINIQEIDDPRARVKEIKKHTGQWGADLVVEVAGVPEAVPEGIRMLGRGGTYLEMGNIRPRQTFKTDPSIITGGNLSILGVSYYPAETLRRAVDFLDREQDRFPFEDLVSHTYELHEIQEAFEASAGASVTRAAVVPCAH